MTFLQAIVRDLREKRLWPVALALAVALVAVPLLLSKPAISAPATASGAAPPAGVASSGTAVPAVSVSSASAGSRLTGRARDPFAQPNLPVAKVATSGTSGSGAKTSGGGTTTSTSKAGSGGTSATGGSGSGTPSGSTPATRVATVTPKPAQAGLTPTQSYAVAFAITNPSGGLDSTDPLERLSVLPSTRQPLLIELGVLKGGHRVLFAVRLGTVVTGPGSCAPGPIDCEILSLAPGQVEQLSKQSSTGAVSVALFAVTQIRAEQYSSPAAAERARRAASAAGRRLLDISALGALSLFQYDPGLGVVLDLRNLTVGGS